jgi:hypothetical protein
MMWETKLALPALPTVVPTWTTSVRMMASMKEKKSGTTGVGTKSPGLREFSLSASKKILN